MKFSKYFMLAGAAAMLAACSSEEPVPAPGTSDAANVEVNAYVSLAIGLPAGDATRAFSNVTYDKGTAEEYDVKNAHLVIFKGDTEADAEVSSIYNITGEWTEAAEGNVTRTLKTNVGITENPANEKIYALVVLNDGDAATHYAAGVKYSDLIGNAASWIATNTTNGIYMTNAPMVGGYTLVELSGANIAPDENTPAAATAQIYVERGVAKVTLSAKASGNSYDVTPKGGEKITGVIQKWDLDITNKTAYPVRNVTGFANWGNHLKSADRIFWAVDPNYSDAKSTVDGNIFNRYTAALPNAVGASEYCLENTMDYLHMNKTQSTRVVLSVKFGNETLYRSNVNGLMYTETELKNYIIEVAQAADKTLEAEKITVEFPDAAGADMAIKSVKYDGTDIDGLVASLGKFYVWKDGIAYYKAIIKNVADNAYEWNKDVAYTADELGRWGVVRNNSYEVVINSINKLGKGTPGELEPKNEPDDQPDPEDEDNDEFAIDFTVNMHSWAKHVQNEDL